MNKNVIIILAIFIVPLAVYFGLTRDKLTTLPSIASQGAEIVKFSSPMCYECQELEKIFDEVFPKYSNKISLKKVDVTQKNNHLLLRNRHPCRQTALLPAGKDAQPREYGRIQGTV